MAQANLARAGAEAVPELARLAVRAGWTMRKRLKETVDLMLINTVDPELIRAHPKLWGLGSAELRRAEAVRKVLSGQKGYESGEEGGLRPLQHPEDWPMTPKRQAVEAMIALQGFGVPAALELLADKEPGSRAYGVEILGKLDAVPQLPVLRQMLNDQGQIEVSHGCYEDQTTVGSRARMWVSEAVLPGGEASTPRH